MKNIQSNVRAGESVADVRVRLNDAILQRKYGLSRNKFYQYKATALDIIAKETGTKFRTQIEIRAKQLLVDIRSRMDDEAAMMNCNLLPRHLQSTFRQLIETGLITPLEPSNRLQMTRSQVREAFVAMGEAVGELD